jgi:hypothetical protein
MLMKLSAVLKQKVHLAFTGWDTVCSSRSTHGITLVTHKRSEATCKTCLRLNATRKGEENPFEQF